MSSMLNYFKRKLRPRCVGSPTHSLNTSEGSVKDQSKEIKMNTNGKLKNKSETKLSQNNKRKFNLKLKRSIKSNLQDLIAGKAVEKQKIKSTAELSATVSNENTNVEDESSKRLSVTDDSKRSHMETYTNCSYSPSQIIDHSKYSKALGKENFIYSTEVEGEFLNSTSLGQTNSSGYVEYATSSSSYTHEPGVANISVNSVADSNQSMVTYNTKYANSRLSDDDGLMSVDGGESMHHSSLSVSENMQQSTPYNENFARIRSLKISKQASIHKSNTANQLAWKPSNLALKVGSNDSELNESYQIYKEEKLKNKCRRSNTTYTLMGSRTNSKVIDYFNKLEMSKPVKKTANIRKLAKISMVVDAISSLVVDLQKVDDEDSKFKKNDAQMSETIESLSKIAGNATNGNEVEKIQDVLFHDESSVINTNEVNASLNSSLSNNSSYVISPPSSVDSPKKLPLLSMKNQSSPQSKESVTDIKLNETQSDDCSMEKLRRTVSMPGIENNFMANVSKISIIKDESMNSNIENNATKSFLRDSIQKMDETNIITKPQETRNEFQTCINNQSACGEFVRGDPKGRTSQKNIKQMFKNVVKYQMSALDSLEKFYEKHVEKLEIDRETALKSHLESQEKINEFFDSQLKLLEDRVQSNLKFICENKCNKMTPSTSSNSNAGYSSVKNDVASEINKNNLLTHKLSQIMLIKQIQLQQHQEDTLGHVSRSRNLTGLKSNLINQNNILPTLISKNQLLKSTSKKDEINTLLGIKSAMYGQNVFKRNLSLRNPIDTNRVNPLLKAKSPKNKSHSTCRIRYKSQEHSTYSPLQMDQVNFYQSNYTKTTNSNKAQFQYQKNVGLRKNYSSSESIAKMARCSNETLNDSELVKQTSEEKAKVEPSNSSTYTKIKRQNKSANSLKLEEFNTPESCGFGNFKLQEEAKNRFRLNYSRNSSIYNSSMRNTSNLNGTFGDSGHLVKYLPPRFSDAHIHLKLNQQKLAATRNELKYLNQKYLSQLQNVPKSLSDLEKSATKLTMPFETSV